jgi:hypothetical protein
MLEYFQSAELKFQNTHLMELITAKARYKPNALARNSWGNLNLRGH